jgi:hypothetical protein
MKRGKDRESGNFYFNTSFLAFSRIQPSLSEIMEDFEWRAKVKCTRFSKNKFKRVLIKIWEGPCVVCPQIFKIDRGCLYKNMRWSVKRSKLMENYTWYSCAKFSALWEIMWCSFRGFPIINYLLLRHLTSLKWNLAHLHLQSKREIKHDKFSAQNHFLRFIYLNFSLYLCFHVGTGTFGRVVLCMEKGEKSFYALKILSINDVIHKKQIEHVKNEKNILLEITHPFIVTMYVSKKFYFRIFPRYSQ